ncbi:MAG TPA: membrane dipeptidase [Gaiellaceae bacterium]|nr:membrane dipeptidase [Gaiellaceae bacterium]
MIVDGHNDVLLRRWRGQPLRHLDLARAAESGFAGGFFAVFVPGAVSGLDDPEPPYSQPLAEPIARDEARRVAEEQTAILERLDVTIAHRADDFQPGRVTAILHLEGAEPLAPDLSDLQAWRDRGLRSLGIAWARRNAFGEGARFAFPSSGDTGPGLTDAGRRLVRACNQFGIVIDVSHLTEVGFWDVAGATAAPLVATHSNAHALCPSSCNLTDEQLDAIGSSGGVVGVNFAVSYLRADGRPDPATPLDEIVRHVDYIAERVGVDHVAFGSDFEGATLPDALGGVRGLPKLVDALRAHGYDDEAVAKITHRNWLRVLDRTWQPWRRYFERADDAPRETLVEAMRGFDVPGLAVDLGCGTGRDTIALLRAGWSVIAIDREPEAIERVRAAAGGGDGRLRTQVARLEDARWPQSDLVNASFVLPFVRPDRFPDVWQRIVDSLRPGGRFSGQLFGDHDEWAGTGLVVQTRAQVEELLEPFTIERLDELDEEGSTVVGARKHWHLFHVVARKR